jgi:hypothetical protein
MHPYNLAMLVFIVVVVVVFVALDIRLMYRENKRKEK